MSLPTWVQQFQQIKNLGPEMQVKLIIRQVYKLKFTSLEMYSAKFLLYMILIFILKIRSKKAQNYA
jgi:hypothetical protein